MAKYCPKCYVGVNADDRICGNCGNVLREEEIKIDSQVPVEEGLVTEVIAVESKANQFDSNEMKDNTNEETVTPKTKAVEQVAVLSLGDWMLTLLLLMIPVVNIVMLIVWSADSKTNPNKRHFAWAQLIYMGIIFVLSIIFSSVFAAIIIGAINSINY